MVSFGIEIGLCGLGIDRGLLPSVRLGVVHFWWCRGSLFARFAKLHVALADAARDLRK